MNPNDENNLMEELKDETNEEINEEESSKNLIQEAVAKYKDNSAKDNVLKDKLMRGLLVIAFIVIAFLIILFIFSIIMNSGKSYSQVEDVMINASKKYYKDNPSLLPKTNGGTVEVSAQNLVNQKYMKSLSKYIKKTSCTGKVVVENNDDDFIYTPYLDCGSTYKTTELYRKITNKDDIVTTGNGLYAYSNEYVFRGDNLNNYVLINEALWRIVKVTKDNETVLIKDDKGLLLSQVWDDRFNTNKNYNSGINDFNVSRIKDVLNSILDDKEANLLDDNIKGHVVSHNYCIGRRNQNDSIGDECSVLSDNLKVGLLTVTDYMNASTDSNCNSTLASSCQNYNYLSTTEYNWWLLTALKENTYQAYYVDNYGKISVSNASSGKKLRPVIYLNSRTMYSSGTGSKDDPYIIK